MKVSGIETGSVPNQFNKWVEAVANDLLYEDGNKDKKRSPGTTLVVAGPTQPPAVHAIVYAINAALGNLGKTVHFTRRIDRPDAESKLKAGTITELTADMKAGKVEVLLILVATLSSRRQPTSILPTHSARLRSAFAWVSTRMKPRPCATGICLRPTTWKAGATPAPSTAPPASSSR